ncbi:ATP-dependent helicase [Kocuria flava]|uniref:ATP-dependent helicase n=1 Tax=Kocuria flava TaxID=446860 RepID=A0A0U3HHV5_9MICC|nr:ATP-dependent helicase C-terminal domain-containing protein [Kocuria flava]ALU40761.1 ATP-dependent helicase [Kocuria flava]
MSAAPFDLDRIGAGLPVAGAAGALRAALAGGAAVVQAPPGSGKTTLVPPLVAALLHERGDGPARVVVTQPRRVAARAAARRLAHLSGTRVGERVGHTVRGDRRAGPGTLVEFVTPGILLRRLLHDPGLPGTGAVVLDEVHERGLETDLLTGMLAELRQLREDLVLTAMSATVDAARFAGLLGGGEPAPVVDSPAVLHPLGLEWAPAPGRRTDGRGVTPAFLDHVARTAAAAHARALAAHPGTDALVFLPGAWEVAQVARRLRAHAPGTEVLELHGRTGAAEQDRATAGRAPGGPPRAVVSTALAESSLTVPGVRLVVDSGLAREPRRDAARGMTGLVTVAASRASAEQRAGRAARLGPGTAVRCYDERTWAGMPAHGTPEVAAADLTGAALLLACWGSPGGRGLALPDPLPPAVLAEAESVLRGLGAVDAGGRATAAGRALARVPADPRLARGLLDGTRASTMAVVRTAAALDRATAERCAEHLLTDTVRASFDGTRVTARRTRALGAIELSATPVPPPPGPAREAVRAAVAARGPGLLGWSEAADRLRRRLALLHDRLGPPWPEVSDAALTAALEQWLAPELDALAAGARGADLAEPLRRLLPWPEASRLEELAPERLAVPSGSRVRIDYPPADDPAGRPVVAVKLQECFGWAATPAVAAGRAPVLFHLLSPAGRPLAVTGDLASFWAGPYAQVRAEMRGRYPKHPWPEDPWTAPATARTTRPARRG